MAAGLLGGSKDLLDRREFWNLRAGSLTKRLTVKSPVVRRRMCSDRQVYREEINIKDMQCKIKNGYVLTTWDKG